MVTTRRPPGGRRLSRGERAADIMRNSMGSWPFVFGALAFLAGWIGFAEAGIPIDNPQLTILNLVLSCLAALQGSILLIAAKRADQIASDLARSAYENGARDYTTDQDTNALVRQLLTEVREHLAGTPPGAASPQPPASPEPTRPGLTS